MPESRQLPPNLLSIKNHIDSHGLGCVIMDDHVAVGVCEQCGEDGRIKEGIRRVRTFDEARLIIGCRCGLSEDGA
ncbi:hypothetical protein PUV54_09465 [Hyphococcus flavus]|uniref:Uncharacterized protein n=1 Tax=Hyphococcus flavus TaxID=1866326 RepID=A0AAE9ZC69_9PROT|nr:hypothetical protein [Hyphococcus flavus]WDI30187.1 hypothetical protein PUV54_09465 [Hyphococcus flavus]